MIRRILLLALVWLMCCCVCAEAAPSQPLLQRSGMTRIGAFRLPNGTFGASTGTTYASESGHALAYNPINNSLFLQGNKFEVLLSEINIPSPLTTSTTMSDLPTATIRQNPIDITGGHGCFIGPSATSKCYEGSGNLTAGGVLLGGILVDPESSRLIGTTFTAYDGPANTELSHFTANRDWSGGVSASGMYRVGTTIAVSGTDIPSAGFLDGYMGWIPTEWQTDFGKKAITGQGMLAVISRTSVGPGLFAFDPADLSSESPAPYIPLVYYPADHPELGAYGETNLSTGMSSSTTFVGVVFPHGSNTVLFFGRTGTGPSCYGTGTIHESEAKSAADIQTWVAANGGALYTCGSYQMDGSNNNSCCWDAAGSDHGTHSFPYQYTVWAYNAVDLLKVKNGDINPVTGVAYKPWDIQPYGVWSLNDDLVPFSYPGNDGVRGHGDLKITGAAYDQATQRIYLSQADPDNPTAIIHVYQLSLGVSPIPGTCGSSNGLSLSSAPTVNLCTAGTPSAASGTGPWSWTCAGSGGGSTASCGATLAAQQRSISVKFGGHGKMTGTLK